MVLGTLMLMATLAVLVPVPVQAEILMTGHLTMIGRLEAPLFVCFCPSGIGTCECHLREIGAPE